MKRVTYALIRTVPLVLVISAVLLLRLLVSGPGIQEFELAVPSPDITFVAPASQPSVSEKVVVEGNGGSDKKAERLTAIAVGLVAILLVLRWSGVTIRTSAGIVGATTSVGKGIQSIYNWIKPSGGWWITSKPWFRALLVFLFMLATIYFRFEKELELGWWQDWRVQGWFFFWSTLLVWGILSVYYPKQSIRFHLVAWILLMLVSTGFVRGRLADYFNGRPSPARAAATTRAETITDRVAYRPVVKQEVLIAPVGEWSRWFTIPNRVRYLIVPEDQVELKTASGQRRKLGAAGEVRDIGKINSVLDATISFRSLSDKTAKVVISWNKL